MAHPNSQYDVFISYASDDRAWVEEQLYNPLARCHRRDGRRARIFFDVSREGGIRAGENFVQALMAAIKSSRKIVPVYSPRYFEKAMCRWELQMAFTLDPVGDLGILNPILKELADNQPEYVSLIQYVAPSLMPDWLDRLYEALELSPFDRHPQLRFAGIPTRTTVNVALEPLSVLVDDWDEDEEDVVVSAEGAELSGTLIRKTQDDCAVFDDLSFRTAGKEVRLVARVEGFDCAYSDSFEVLPAARTLTNATDTQGTRSLTIPEAGDAVFFTAADAVAVFSHDRVSVYTFTKTSIEKVRSVALTSFPKSIRRWDTDLVWCDWNGDVYRLTASGKDESIFQAPISEAIPAGIASDGASLYIGYWNGVIARVDESGRGAVVLKHAAGVQQIAAATGAVYIADFDSRLSLYRNGRLANTDTLEPCLWWMGRIGDAVIAVGEHRLHRTSVREFRLLHDTAELTVLQGAVGESTLLCVIDREGKGVCLDGDLTIRRVFRTAPGAMPIGTDQLGNLCVVQNSDGSRSLLEHCAGESAHVLLNHTGGTLAIHPTGDTVARGFAGGIEIVSKREAAARDGTHRMS